MKRKPKRFERVLTPNAIAHTQSDKPKIVKTKLLLLAMAVAVSCSVLIAAGNMDEKAKTHVKTMLDDGSITNVINLLVTSGTFCQVRGHTWGQHDHVTLEYSPSRIGCRECKLCRYHQSQYATEWK